MCVAAVSLDGVPVITLLPKLDDAVPAALEQAVWVAAVPHRSVPVVALLSGLKDTVPADEPSAVDTGRVLIIALFIEPSSPIAAGPDLILAKLVAAVPRVCVAVVALFPKMRL